MAAAKKRKRVRGRAANTITHLSPDERRAKGRALRDQVSRASQAGWKPPRGRADPIEILKASNEGRLLNLVPIRFGRMSESPFAFYRGSAAVMAADLARTPTSGIRVQACGDGHLMNFGGFTTPERNVIFDINDLDETLPAPFEWDLKRLAASVVIAAQHLSLPDADAARAAAAAAREYREQIANYASMRVLDVWYDRIDMARFEKFYADEGLLQEARKRWQLRAEEGRRKSVPEYLFPKLVSVQGRRPQIKDEPPLIFHPTAEQAPGMETGFADAIAGYRESLPEHTRTLFDRFQFVDLAMKVVGVGSVGTMCGIALFMASDNDSLILQIKEARTSVLEPFAGKSVYPNNGQRVVLGQRLMQTASDVFLGWTLGKSGRHFYIRQLRDGKISAVIEDWDTRLLRAYGRMCAHALARAHARSGDAALIAGYLGSARLMDDAVTEFAVDYADQNQRDYRLFVRAIRQGRLKAKVEE
jgi:uncharacterized protein (DUF2252 family)